MTCKIYFDGGTRGNRVCVYKYGEKPVIKVLSYPQTNNQLEYTALIFALRLIKKRFNVMELNKVYVYGDSQLIVDQMHGDNEVRSPKLIDLHQQAVEEMNEIMFNPDTNLVWVPRNENLAGQVLDK